jgi:hypothetical protein
MGQELEMEEKRKSPTTPLDRAKFKAGALLAGGVLYYLGSRAVGHKVSVDAAIVLTTSVIGVFVWTYLWESRRDRKTAGK